MVNSTHVTIYTYAVCIVVGAAFATAYIKKASKKELGITVDNKFFYFAFMAGYIGGKFLFFLEKPDYYLSHLKEFVTISGGFVVYGSLIFIVIYTVLFCKSKKINPFGFLDIIAIGCVIPMILGRLGCFFGGCCYGKETSFFTSVLYPTSHGIQTIHPVQLYDACILTAMFIIMTRTFKHKKFQGQIFLFFIGCYAVSRFLLEFLRGDFRGDLFYGIISHSQTIAIITFFLIIIAYKKINTNTLSITIKKV